MDIQNNHGPKYNYYDILEVSPHSQQHEVTQAYERAKATYSGENPAIYTIFSPEEARNMVQLIEEAYSVLGSKTLRTIYDEKMSQVANQKVDLSYEAIKNISQSVYPDMEKKNQGFKLSYAVSPEMESHIANETAWNGEFIKKVREYKQVTVLKMSEITKINSFYITGIEDMKFKELPAPVFIRGYLVQIAKALQLDEKKVADAYMKIYRSHLES